MTTAVRHGFKLEYRPRLQGAERRRVAKRLRRQYEKGRSVRNLAEEAGYSYGTTHALLQEAGTVMRDRQGRLPGEAPAIVRMGA
ncbi:helix-turn-helix domain-containing protein [Streptomyces collinus]